MAAGARQPCTQCSGSGCAAGALPRYGSITFRGVALNCGFYNRNHASACALRASGRTCAACGSAPGLFRPWAARCPQVGPAIITFAIISPRPARPARAAFGWPRSLAAWRNSRRRGGAPTPPLPATPRGLRPPGLAVPRAPVGRARRAGLSACASASGRAVFFLFFRLAPQPPPCCPLCKFWVG